MERTPRVLVAIASLDVGEPAFQAVSLTRELAGLGFDPRLVWGSGAPGRDQLSPLDGTAATHLPWLTPGLSPAGDLRASWELLGLMRRWRPQVVHTHLAKAGVLGRAVARRVGVPVVVHSYGPALEERATALGATARLEAERHLAARTDALIAPEPGVRDRLLAMGIGREDRWHVMPAGEAGDPFAHERLAGDLADLYAELLARIRSTSSQRDYRTGVVTG